MRKTGALALALMLGAAMPARAQGAADMAKKFGAREEVEQASLSPDGNAAAFVQPLGGAGVGALYR